MHKLIVFAGGILVGFGMAWIVVVIQNEYKLYRDFTINELLKENKKYKRIVDKYRDSNSGY